MDTHFEPILEGSDRTARGPISYWHRRERARKEYSEESLRMTVCTQSLEAHVRHYREHFRDSKSAIRLARLLLQQREIAPRLKAASDAFAAADAEYRRRMISLADIPLLYLPRASVDILDQTGSARINFGPVSDDGQRSGRWILYPNGEVDRQRTPVSFE